MATIDMGDTKFPGTEVDGRGYGVILASIICPGLAFIFVALRWCVRLGITKSLHFDDWMALLTLCSNIAYSVIQGLATQPYIGIGNHQNDFDHTQQESEYYKWVYMFDTFYILSLLGYKTTIVLLFIRVFGIRKHFKYMCFVALFIIDGYLFGSLVAQLIGCIPPNKFWHKSLPGFCIDYLSFDIGYGCLNIITDLMITILPLREIWRLFMPIKEKVWASFIFSSAFIAFGTAIVSQTFRLEDLFAEDRTYRAAATFVWQTIEINTGLICSCTPVLRPLWIKTVSTITGSYKTNDTAETERTHRTVEKDRLEKHLDGDTLNDRSPDPTRRHDLEKGADPNSIGVAVGGGATGNMATRVREVHSEAYASPLPSDQEPHVRPSTAATDQLGELPEAAEDRGRAAKRPEEKRLSQAELERMVLEANVAKDKLEEQAERSRHRYESDVRQSDFSVPMPMLDPMPDPVSPVTESDTAATGEESPGQARRKTSCDLEKGIGLRV